MKKVNIETIATQLGVSKTLVSLVLNGKAKESRIGDEIAKKVIALAKELNYRPNYFARSLRKGTTNTIGLVVSDISNPFFAKIARYIEDVAEQNNYQLIIGSSDERPEKTEGLINLLLDKKVDGLIITPTSDDSKIILELKKQSIPFVLLDRKLARVKTNYVGLNNDEGMRMAVNHLVNQQFEKIALLSYQSQVSNIKERVNGFKNGIKESGLKLSKNYIREVSYSNVVEDVRKEIDALLKLAQVPRAIVFATNNIGLIGLEYFSELGIRIPQDISVVSFDDDPAFRISYPQITVVDQPLKRMAVKAAELLIQNIKSPENHEFKQIIESAELIVRQS